MTNKKHESVKISYSSEQSLDARMEIYERLKNYPATPEESERSLGLFLRGSLLARLLAIKEIYEMILDKPGCIIDLGTWRGQTAVLCENLRAIMEPLHLNRRIVCFDTFEGYQGFGANDKPTEVHQDGTYGVGGEGYKKYLEELLVLHEKSNAMGHINGKHKVIQGDCRVEVPRYFDENQNEFVACAFFDVNAYDPTAIAFRDLAKISSRRCNCFLAINKDVIPAEGAVYNNIINSKVKHTVNRSQYYPGLCYLVKGVE